jgi:hypothetical protein
VCLAMLLCGDGLGKTVLAFFHFVTQIIMASPQKMATKNDHNELANHWSDVVRLGLNPVDSDNTCERRVSVVSLLMNPR